MAIAGYQVHRWWLGWSAFNDKSVKEASTRKYSCNLNAFQSLTQIKNDEFVPAAFAAPQLWSMMFAQSEEILQPQGNLVPENRRNTSVSSQIWCEVTAPLGFYTSDSAATNMSASISSALPLNRAETHSSSTLLLTGTCNECRNTFRLVKSSRINVANQPYLLHHALSTSQK